MTRYGYIAFEGLIGAGKTTITRRVAEDLNGRLVLEEFDDNPFLPRFYAEPERYAFSVELSFLAQRYHQLKRVTERDLFHSCTVADYSIGKSLVFARVTLPQDECALFMDLYDIMYADLPRPDLLVYLHLPVEKVRARIASRGRSYEQNITNDYLGRLQERYLDHLQKLSGQRVLVLEVGDHDLRIDSEGYRHLLRLLEEDHTPGFQVRAL
jgi:deoxyguanosine kinase